MGSWYGSQWPSSMVRHVLALGGAFLWWRRYADSWRSRTDRLKLLVLSDLFGIHTASAVLRIPTDEAVHLAWAV